MSRTRKARYRGLSPRGRGKLYRRRLQAHRRRSIPAWAGETMSMVTLFHSVEVYPRVGGGNTALTTQAPAWAGLSPRGRGKPALIDPNLFSYRSIPAWAGETRRRHRRRHSRRVYPRVGGGNTHRVNTVNRTTGLSPRGRGKPGISALCKLLFRSIPAWAGETHSSTFPVRGT